MSTGAALPLALIIGFLLGSLPFAYWIAKAKGIDLKTVGTKNPGAANLFRKVSKPLGVFALVLDAGKGAVAIWVAQGLGLSDSLSILAGVAAIFGNLYSPFLGWKGGAGLALAVGIGLAASPIAWLVALAVGLPYLIIKKNTGFATGAGLIAYVITAVIIDVDWPVILGVALINVALAVRARAIDAIKSKTAVS